jgi:Domain of unknown function (DUF4124)
MKRVLLCAVLLAWSGLASAVVYKWIDSQGKLQYGDRPPDGVHAQIVEGLGNHSSRSEQPRPPVVSASTASSQSAKGAPSTQAAVSTDDIKKAVDDDVAQVKEKQCADAQARYKSLIEGRKLYKAGADGERQYLTSEEIDAERLNAKREVDTICNSPT